MSSDGSPPASPPARRAPSARASKGNRMASLIAQEEDEREDDADKEFYEQDFWADAEEDAEYAMEADDEGADSFDSDFGDSSESDGDDGEEEEKAARKAAKPKKRSVYVDPKARADKQAAGEGGAGGGAAPRPRKRPRSELAGLDPIVARGSLRASTKDATAQAQEKRRQAIELAERRKGEGRGQAGRRGVELVRLTQEEILAEAAQTEIINRASLEQMLRVEEEKRKVVVRDRRTSGPRVVTKSTREGDSVRTYVTFTDGPLPPAIDDVAPDYPPQVKCAVTGQPARYFDPASRSPYATLEAFRTLRGERRVRPSAS